MNKLKLYGRPDSSEIYPIRDFLNRSVVDFEWVDLKTDESEQGDLYTLNPEAHPMIEFPDGKLIVNPSLEEIASILGWITKPKYKEYDLSIYGAGPAGLSAAVYAASEGLKTILIEREAVGGQAGTSSMIENYLGFPNGISGANLAERARQQALKFGVEILLLKEGVKGTFYDKKIHVDFATGEKLVAKTNICATGVEYARLNLPDENRFFHKGVYYGAGASEAYFCQDKDLYIVGGGNSAGQAAVYFSGFAKRVFMVIRKGNLSDTLSDYLIRRISSIGNIEVLYHSQVIELDGDDHLQQIKIANSKEETEQWHETSKLFICIGGKPNTQWASETAICRDINGYLYTGSDLIGQDQFTSCWSEDRQPYHLETSVPGSFAAGDVRFNSVKRVASAVGEGAMAVTQVHQYLSKL
ncbi:FAD-dependent oxidoreductase [Chryseobacterium wangxinyae]|uniref:NAD(P)/FAD-dependent oxidoreductase n=1 Tax=Chryseobacterium sp. CY350 TaxID=2997336 RepID=UPI002271238E|nr:FAD-dependent oxidoreductase [Chryseobacterium sp. CY350]MCY0979301.1 FAD-dependent oxidoreductase [Chryseobacterium sp. CY350]WBZ95933.1 FAD-dependent oxidoreductase [Chryseobacterium sp. CY350]